MPEFSVAIVTRTDLSRL